MLTIHELHDRSTKYAYAQELCRFSYLALLFVMIAFFVWIASGCSSVAKPDPRSFGPVPSVEVLTEGYNKRIEELDTLWARISIRVRGGSETDDPFEEQGTGHLQLRRPDDISISVRKLGELYFAYGATAEEYWAFNLLDQDRKTQLIGKVDLLNEAKADAIGMPIPPGQLIPLIGLVPVELRNAGGVRWADDGQSVVVKLRSRWGVYDLYIDPDTYRAVRSDVYRSDGSLLATTTLTRYTDAKVSGSSSIAVPGKIEVRFPESDDFLRIELSEPQRKKLHSNVFNQSKLRRAYRIDEVIDLDQQPSMQDPQQAEEFSP